MNYTVIYPDAMIDELTRQYVLAYAAGFGTAFTEAIHRIDTRLADDPLEDTESRAGNLRVAIESPIAVYFRIESGAPRVTILGIRFTRPRAR